MSDGQADKQACIGVIKGARGLRGHVHLKLFLEEPQRLQEFAPLTFQDGKEAVLSEIAFHGNQAYARLRGVESREAAQALKGTRLYADRNSFPAPAEGEYYYDDLVGLTVLRLGGIVVGRVESVQDYGAGDLLEIRLEGRKDTIFLPFTDDYVPQVEVAEGFVVVDLPDGLLDG